MAQRLEISQDDRSGPRSQFRGRRATWVDWGGAGVLAIAYVVLVMQTTSMGITRDESFYIHYGKVYLNWFTRLARAEGDQREELLSRAEVKRVWKQNFEHPPLMKVLFGASWRFLGRKDRPATRLDDGMCHIGGLGLSHGFEVGDEVPLFGPLPLGDGVRESQGTLRIIHRELNEARAELVEELPDGGKACVDSAADPVHYRSGCVARSGGVLQVLSESGAFRFPGAVMGGLLILLIYLFALEFGSRAMALTTVGLFVFVPRVFFHAHLTCFDIPITAVSFAVLYAFWRSLSSRWWAVVAAFLWGVALLTKLNSFFLPITLMLWWGIAGLRGLTWSRWRLSLPPFPLALLLMPLVGLPMLFLFWPWLWYDALASFGKYLSFHLDHEHYFQYYFGRAYQSPPFPVAMPYVLTLVTVPVITVVLFVVGVGRCFFWPAPEWLRCPRGWWSQQEELHGDWGRGAFVLVNLAFPITLIAMPNTPVFGGVKHWFLSMPFFCLIAAHGLHWLLVLARGGLPRRLQNASPALRWSGATVLAVVLLAPAVRDTLRYVPFGTAYYNEFIGGLPGAADSRMQRQFWSFASRSALPYVNAVAPEGTTIDFQDATRGTCQMQRQEAWMRADLECATRKYAPEILLFDVEERFAEEEMRYWAHMDTLGPVHEGGIDGVPMVRVYRKHAGFTAIKSMLTGEGSHGL